MLRRFKRKYHDQSRLYYIYRTDLFPITGTRHLVSLLSEIFDFDHVLQILPLFDLADDVLRVWSCLLCDGRGRGLMFEWCEKGRE